MALGLLSNQNMTADQQAQVLVFANQAVTMATQAVNASLETSAGLAIVPAAPATPADIQAEQLPAGAGNGTPVVPTPPATTPPISSPIIYPSATNLSCQLSIQNMIFDNGTFRGTVTMSENGNVNNNGSFYFAVANELGYLAGSTKWIPVMNFTSSPLNSDRLFSFGSVGQNTSYWFKLMYPDGAVCYFVP